MAVTKKFLKSKPVCKVTFELTATNASTVSLVGDFNEWKNEATPLKKLKNGNFKVALDLPANQSFEYKFIVDGSYTNDPEADKLIWNSFANTENSLLEL